MKKINRKAEGFLESEVVKIIIAVICISFLIYFAFLIYQASREKNEGRQAKATLEEIVLRFEKMDVNAEASYLYLAPENYYFHVSDENSKLAQCVTKYCLCLCDKDDCSDFNICRKTDKLFLLGSLNNEKIDAPKTYLLKNSPELYIIQEQNAN